MKNENWSSSKIEKSLPEELTLLKKVCRCAVLVFFSPLCGYSPSPKLRCCPFSYVIQLFWLSCPSQLCSTVFYHCKQMPSSQMLHSEVNKGILSVLHLPLSDYCPLTACLPSPSYSELGDSPELSCETLLIVLPV